MITPLTIVIGYDPNETAAFYVCQHSLMRHSSIPLNIVPLNKRNIEEFSRDKGQGATEFSYSRFLTPWLSGYVGRSIFVDCDFIFVWRLAATNAL